MTVMTRRPVRGVGEPVGGHAASELGRLQRARRQARLSAALIVALLIGLACVDILGSASSHWQAVVYNALYSLLASLLASSIVSWVLFQQRIRDRQRQGRFMLKLLGLASPGPEDRVAIVVSAFPVPIGGEASLESVAHPDGTSEIVGDLPENLLKDWREIANHAYARRDMLLVLDIARLLGTAGLPPPLVVSDYDLLQAIHESTKAGGRTSGLAIRTDSSGIELPVRVTHVILIGLWSNLATMQLQRNPSVPFELSGVAERSIHLLVPGMSGGMLRPPERPTSPERPIVGEGVHALIAKFHLPELCISVIGGTNALGTARLGDFILHPEVRDERLEEARDTDDVWLGIECPPAGHRWGGYGTWCCETHPAFLQEQVQGSLADLFRLRHHVPGVHGPSGRADARGRG